jgi:hypothetical protein
MSSSLTVQQAADFSGTAYDELENGSIVDGYMLVYQEHDTSTGFQGQVWRSISDPTQVVFAFAGTDSTALVFIERCHLP